MELTENQIVEIIGSELAINIYEQYGVLEAISLPRDNWKFFTKITREIRSTW